MHLAYFKTVYKTRDDVIHYISLSDKQRFCLNLCHFPDSINFQVGAKDFGLKIVVRGGEITRKKTNKKLDEYSNLTLTTCLYTRLLAQQLPT